MTNRDDYIVSYSLTPNFFRILIILLFFSAELCLSALHHERYFQQYVRYNIDVELDISDNTLAVRELLMYKNNSPDTLSSLYFHLYINKYRRHSLAFPDQSEDRGWIEIIAVTENDSSKPDFIIDQTLMNLELHRSLAPGDSVKLDFEFEVKLPPASGRYGYQGLHYDVGNWYVTPVVYDRAGWHRHQHLDNEFYQEWGDYYVTIRVPQDFRIGATGNLQNGDEVLPLLDNDSPEWLRADYSDTILIAWDFEALRVHDFAWTADPSYELLQAEWNGITLNVLVLDYNVKSWKDVTDWGIKGLQYFSEKFGPYPYKQLTVADTYVTAGGIEYPQIVMINDFINPDYEQGEFRAVVLHEMAHNWFYGLLANNQLEHEWLDEGFTTFAEIKAMEAIFGVKGNMAPADRGWLFNHFGYTSDNRLDQIYSYLRLAKWNLDDDPVDLHADYLGPDGYILQYSKMASVLFMLEYTLGDSIFSTGMLNYYHTWAFRHPYPGDFIAVMEKTSGQDLGWFFDQWLHTNRKLDYAVEDVDCEEAWSDTASMFESRISLKRKEKLFMPINLDVYLTDGQLRQYRIPVDNYSTYREREILPSWHFSRSDYSVNLRLSGEIEHVTIDPDLTLLDVYRLDNTSGWLPPMEWHFMRAQSRAPPLDRYIWEVWPLAFYNDIDKAKIGINFQGGYLNIDHLINLNVWYKTATTRIDFDLDYQTPVSWLGKLSEIQLRLFILDGRQGGQIGVIHRLSRFVEPNIEMRFGLANHQLFDTEYLPGFWDKGNVNNMYLAWQRTTTYRGWNPKQNLQIYFHTSIPGSAFNYSQIYFNGTHKFWDGFSDIEFDVRLFAGYSEQNVPAQYLFNLGGDNGWGEFQHIFYRSKGSLPWPWKRNGNLYKSGGPDIKGYSLYNINSLITGRNALALNLDLKLGNPAEGILPYYLRLISPHIWVDGGNVWNGWIPSMNTFKASAGFGFAWQAPDLMDYIFRLKQIRVDFPLWLSDPVPGQSNIQLRWQIRLDF